MTHSVRWLIAAVALLGWTEPAVAADLRGVLTGYGVTTWSQRDGLPGGSVDAITQDPAGYLWIGTRSGLFRFDGVRFVAANALTPAQLPDAPVRALLAAHDGSLWVGFGDGGGIERLSDATGRVFDAHDGVLGIVNALAEDRRGAVWAATTNGLFRFAGGRWEQFRQADGVPVGAVYSVYVMRVGDLLIGTDSGIFQVDADRARARLIGAVSHHEQTLIGAPIALGEDSLGRVCVNDAVTGFRRIGDAREPMQATEQGRGTHLLLDRSDNLWVGTSGQGVWRVRATRTRRADAIERISSATGLLSDGVESLFEDRDGNVWIGTTEGLHRLKPWKVDQVVNIGLIEGVDVAAGGSVWAGTVDALQRIAVADGTPAERISLGGALLRAFDATGDSFWVATDRYLARLVNGHLIRAGIGTALPAEIDAISGDRAGGVWFDDVHEGAFHWNGHSLERRSYPAEVHGVRVLAMYTDRTRRLWVAFADGHVGTIDASGDVRLFGRRDRADGGPYRAVYEDAAGAIWLAGSEGLTRFRRGRFDTVRRGSGFTMALTAIADDRAGRLYLGSRSGILRLDVNAFDAALASGRLRYALYDRSDGLAGLPLSYVNSRRAVRTDDDRLWFVTARGLTIVNPRVLPDSSPPPVRIEGVGVDDRRIVPSDELVLPPRASRVEINYTLLDLTSPLRARFRYRLDGFDREWIDAGTRRQATYTNLPPRAYRFRVAAYSANGTWDETDASWQFSIQPAFEQTRLFYASVVTVTVAIVALVVWAVWRLRLRKMRHEFAILLGERVRVSREIHDTLLQSLVGVALQLDAMASSSPDSPDLPGAVRKRFVLLRKHVEEYIREARQSIRNLRSPRLAQMDLVSALRDAGDHATAANGAAFSFDVVGTPRQAAPRVENELLHIGREAVTNAARHAHASRIRMQIEYDPRAIVLNVADDGCGFEHDKDTPDGGCHYGLTSMRERAGEVGGTLTIVSAAGRGTTVTTVVPLA